MWVGNRDDVFPIAGRDDAISVCYSTNIRGDSLMDQTHPHDDKSSALAKKKTWRTPELVELPTEQTAGGVVPFSPELPAYKPAS